MAKDILKEAIADAKSVREVALANAKAALEEAFTPKLQSMLSAKLSEELNESEEEIDENVTEEPTIDEVDDIDEMVGMDEDEQLDEEIDLEEILNELELEEGEEAEKTIDENDEEETLEELGSPQQAHSEVSNVLDTADNVYENENFDLDTLLEEINNLDETSDDVLKEGIDPAFITGFVDTLEGIINAVGGNISNFANSIATGEAGGSTIPMVQRVIMAFYGLATLAFSGAVTTMILGIAKSVLTPIIKKFSGSLKGSAEIGTAAGTAAGTADASRETSMNENVADAKSDPKAYLINFFTKEATKQANRNNSSIKEEDKEVKGNINSLELHETKKVLKNTKSALKVVRKELNEVNLLNSKLLYVNRIFKANTLDDVQKLRVVETLDKAESAKEAKLIYETIKDTFTISKGKKVNPKRSIREGLGMASKAAGKSTAPKKAVLNESNDMVARMQKLANITIKQ